MIPPGQNNLGRAKISVRFETKATVGLPTFLKRRAKRSPVKA